MNSQNNIPKVVIIILNWNGWKDTIECLESISNIIYSNYAVVVVDNNSTDESVKKIREYWKGKIERYSIFYKNNLTPLKIFEYTREESSIDDETNNLFVPNKSVLIQNNNNEGFAIGNNIGIAFSLKYLNPDFILLLNNDTTVEKNFLKELIDNVTQDKKIGLASPIIYEYYNNDTIQYSSDKIRWFSGRITLKKDKKQDILFESDTICGASMLIRKELINDIGLLPEEYFMLWEDIDYSVKTQRAGYKLVYVKSSKIWHKGSASIGKITSPIRIKYSIRNRFIFWKKYSTSSQYFCFITTIFLIHFPLFIICGLLKSNDKIQFFKYFKSGLKLGINYNR